MPSCSAEVIASARTAYIATVSAFFLSGRSRTTCRTPSRSSTEMPIEIIGRTPRDTALFPLVAEENEATGRTARP